MTSLTPNQTPVDLGLPSGTKWAPCNVGAFSPSELGDFFAFGETETKKVFSRDNYSFNKDEFLLHFREKNKDQDGVYHIGFTPYDVATIKKGTWKIPSSQQFRELLKCCTFEYDGHGAWCISVKNGNKIYFPANGYRREDHEESIYCFDGWIDDYDFFPHGYYWTDSMIIDEDCLGLSGNISALYFFFDHIGRRWDDYQDNIIFPEIQSSLVMEDGYLIRPVFCE